MVKILTICYGGRETVVLVRIFIITSLLLFNLASVKAGEELISMPEFNHEINPEINEDMLKQSREILNSVQKVQTSDQYKKHQNWINQNSQKLFARQTEQLPTIDYNIPVEQSGNAHQKDIKEDVIAKMLNKYRFKSEDIKKAQITHFPVMIFVSSSIPKSSLKDLMTQAKNAGAVLVFRGMIVSLKNTAKFLGDINKDNVQAIIDPRLFDLFKIEVVPTIVVLKEATQDCGIGGDCKITPIHDRISGNITLDYALETISSGKSEASSIAAQFLTKIRARGDDEKL